MASGASAVTMDDLCTGQLGPRRRAASSRRLRQIRVVSGAPIGNRATPPGTAPGWGSAWKKAG